MAAKDSRFVVAVVATVIAAVEPAVVVAATVIVVAGFSHYSNSFDMHSVVADSDTDCYPM